jgi:UDPglucose 6-dehydrogenase|tara:strand:+ start:1722 stop:2528 length:807 start_codon:yes stop_codon:yes gene_type:complete
MSLKLGIVGHGFVGSAVANGFDIDTEQFIVDTKQNNNTLEQLVNDFDPSITFICVPTPQQDSHYDVDVSIARQTLQDLTNLKYKGIVVIKSTITPHHLTQFKKDFKLKIVYNPEFLTEANSFDDFINPNMQVLGGKWRDCDSVEKAYVRHSSVKTVPTFKVDLITASLIKYTINSWLATKVIWFNQLKDLYDDSGARASWKQFTDMLNEDPRVGDSHMQVPGPDGIKGFGGHCFPKDTKALLYYSKLKSKKLRALEHIIKYNAEYRDD